MYIYINWVCPTVVHLYDMKGAELYKEPPRVGHEAKKNNKQTNKQKTKTKTTTNRQDQ